MKSRRLLPISLSALSLILTWYATTNLLRGVNLVELATFQRVHYGGETAVNGRPIPSPLVDEVESIISRTSTISMLGGGIAGAASVGLVGVIGFYLRPHRRKTATEELVEQVLQEDLAAFNFWKQLQHSQAAQPLPNKQPSTTDHQVQPYDISH
ncbi:MAG TPA: hypothetical protein V6D18_15375 [Thermosynechococcaceae cyanobacterium]